MDEVYFYYKPKFKFADICKQKTMLDLPCNNQKLHKLSLSLTPYFSLSCFFSCPQFLK